MLSNLHESMVQQPYILCWASSMMMVGMELTEKRHMGATTRGMANYSTTLEVIENIIEKFHTSVC